jgi:ribonuclease G
MQSAFVDLGLERDTFLYVSDFFDETDEEDFDSVADPRPPRAQRPPTPPPAIVSAPPPAPVPEPEPPAPAAAPEPAISGSTAPDRGGEDADRNDRRGRRSRRRRGRGRGFPESKYASSDAGPRAEEPEEREEPAAAPAETGPVFLLPGESLAKYRNRPAGAGESRQAAQNERIAEAVEDSVPETTEDVPQAAAAVEEPTVEADEDRVFAAPVHDTDSETEDEAVADEDAFAPEPDTKEPNEDNAEAFADEIEESRNLPEQPESESAYAAAEELLSESDAAEEEEEDETAEPEQAAEAGESRTAEASEQPLTANVREQGGRYMHRASRRMRRKMRGGQKDDTRVETAAPAEENRVVQRDRADRPERQERGDRPDRGGERQDRGERGGDRTGDRGERPARAERGDRDRDRTPQPSISELLREGQEIIVQIAKEPLGQKGARITSHIALPGRYVVYMPTLEHLGVSRKIASDEERLRLKRILHTHRTGTTGGFIVRTAGEGRTEDEIAADMAFLYNLWLDIRQKAEKRPAPALLHHDLDIVQRVLRDQLNEEFKAVWSDNEDTYESVLRFIQRFQPALVNRVKMYTRPGPIFDAFGVTAELEKALRPKVWLKSGGYIVINQTEALVAIDVNTGKYVGKSNRLEDTITKTNTEAVKEIVRQIRLRDLGGIIVVDFIDMDERKNRQKVMQTLEEAMRADRAPYKILQFNDFGLVAITRKRVKQSLERSLCTPCPVCEGAGYTKSVNTVVTEILQEATKMRGNVDGKNVVLRTHPEVAKFLKSNSNDFLEELESIVGRAVLVKSDPLLHPEKFDLAL